MSRRIVPKRKIKNMSQFAEFVTEGNEKADDLATAGAMLDEGFMAEARAKTMQQEREEVYVASQYAASFSCLVEQWKDCEELRPKPKEKKVFVEKKSENTMHQTEWCADANWYRCMRCGRGSKHMKMPGKCTGPKFLSKSLDKWGRRHLGCQDLVRRMNRQGGVLIWCREWSGYARQKMGPKGMNCRRPEQVGTKEYGKMLKRIQTLEHGRVLSKEAKIGESRTKEKNHKKGVSKARTSF